MKNMNGWLKSAVALVALVFGFAAHADNWIDHAADSFASQDDTKKEITIATAEQLAWLAKQMTDESLIPAGAKSNYYYDGWKFTITADIDLSGKEWTPIASSATNGKFNGHVDGGNHTISGLTISSGTDYCGLFGLIGYHSETGLPDDNPTVIENLVLDGASIVNSSNSGTGVLAGGMKGGRVKNVTVKNSTVRGPKYVGGVVGYSYGNLFEGCKVCGSAGTPMTICLNDGAAYQAGGVVGIWRGDEGNNQAGTIKDCLVQYVSIDGNEVGGLVGRLLYRTASVLTNCVADVTLTATEDHTKTPTDIGTKANLYLGTFIGRDYESAGNTVVTNGNTTTPPAPTSYAQIGETKYEQMADAIGAVTATPVDITIVGNGKLGTKETAAGEGTEFTVAGVYNVGGTEWANLGYLQLNPDKVMEGTRYVLNITNSNLIVTKPQLRGWSDMNVTDSHVDFAIQSGASCGYLYAFKDSAVTITNSVVGYDAHEDARSTGVVAGQESKVGTSGEMKTYIYGTLAVVDSTLFTFGGDTKDDALTICSRGLVTLKDSVLYSHFIRIGKTENRTDRDTVGRVGEVATLELDNTKVIANNGEASGLVVGDALAGKLVLSNGSTINYASINATVNANGTIAIDATSQIKCNAISNEGVIEVDMTGATADSYTLIDAASASTYGTYQFATGKANGYELKVEGNDLIAEKPAVAQVTISGVTTKYANLHEALEAAKPRGAVCELLSDVDLTGKWTPVGTAEEVFLGTFDGKGFAISGLDVDVTGDYAGLVGYAYGNDEDDHITVKNVTIQSPSITGKKYAGVVFGLGFRAMASNVTVVAATVNGTKYVGGIAGGDYCDVIDCTIINGTVSGVDQVGGAIGYICEASVVGCTATNNVVTASEERAGGLVGKLNVCNSGMRFLNNVVSGTATCTADKAGGLAAEILGSDDDPTAYVYYEIKNNEIDVAVSGKTVSPIGALRNDAIDSFKTNLAANVTGNTWTTQTYPQDSYTYTYTTTGDVPGQQTIWNGEPPACKIVETGATYETLADAVQAVAEGQTIKLLGNLTVPASDAGENGRITAKKSYTLQGEGYTVTCANASEWDWDSDGNVVTFDNVAIVGGRTSAGGTFYFMNSKFTNHTTLDCYQLYTYRNTCFVDATSRLIGRTEEFHLRKGFVVVGAPDFNPASIAITATNTTAQLYTKRLGMRESGVLALTNANITAEMDIRSNSVKTKYSDIIATNSLIEIGRSVEYETEAYPLGSWCPNAVPNGRGSMTLAVSQRVDLVSCVLRGANSFSNAGLFIAKDTSIEFGNDFTNTGDFTLDASDMVLGTDFTGPSTSQYHGNFVNNGTIFLKNGATLSYKNKAASTGTIVVSGSTVELENVDIKADETMTFDKASKITFTGTWSNAGDVSFDMTGATADQYVLVENNGSAVVDVAGYAITLTNGEGYELKVVDNDLIAKKIPDFYQDAQNPNLWHIRNVNGLKEFRDSVDGGTLYAGKTIQLDADVDLGNVDWNPIGDGGSNQFAGTFDGQNHTVSNLYIDGECDKLHGVKVEKGKYVGLFAATEYGSAIRNLTIHNVELKNLWTCAGALVGGDGSNEADISNVHVTGLIKIGDAVNEYPDDSAANYVGGILGKGYCSIANCSVVGDAGSFIKSSNYYVGGIAGWIGEGNGNHGNNLTDCSVQNVHVAGWAPVGGICGIAHYYNTISNCTVAANVTVENYATNMTKYAEINGMGGIAGVSGNGANDVTISGNTFAGTLVRGGVTLEPGDECLHNQGIIGVNNGATSKATISQANLKMSNNTSSYAYYVAKIGETRYETLAAAYAAAKAGDTINLLVSTIGDIGGIPQGVTIEGVEGMTTVTEELSQSEPKLNGVTLRKLKFTSTTDAIRYCYLSGASTFTLEDCEFDQTGWYSLHFDGETQNGKIVARNTIFRSTVAIAGGIACEFDLCQFLSNTHATDVGLSLYTDSVLRGCTFAPEFVSFSGEQNGSFYVKGAITISMSSCAMLGEGKKLTDMVNRSKLATYNGVVAIDAGKNGEGQYSSGMFVTKDAENIPLAADCELIAQGNDVYQIGVMIDPGKGEKTVPAIEQTSDSVVNSNAVDKVVKDTEVAERMKADTTVAGVKLTTEAPEGQSSGVQAAVDKAKEENAEVKEALDTTASMVTVKVDVVVSPTSYTPPEAQEAKGAVAFDLTPLATVTVVTTNSSGEVESTVSQVVDVTNGMIDQNQKITVVIYTGFLPSIILHKDDNGKLIESFSGDQIAYKDGTCAVQVSHFSTLTAIQNASYVAAVDGQMFDTLQGAFDAVSNGTVTLLKDVELTACVTLAEGKKATFDLAGKTVKWAGNATAKSAGLIANAGELTLAGGTMDAGATVFATCTGDGETYITEGIYHGTFQTPASSVTNAGPFAISGGYFDTEVPAAYCANGYVPDPEPKAAHANMYTVKDALVYIRNVTAKQRYPWNGYVDITFEMCMNRDTPVTLFVAAYYQGQRVTGLAEVTWVGGDQQTVNVADGSFKVAAKEPRTIHLAWNSNVEGAFPDMKADDITVKVIAK